MRTLIDIEEESIKELDRLAARQKRSRAALIRDAVSDYLDRNAVEDSGEAFGLWGERKTDGLRYQEKLRSEW
ncbi:MAG: ribbon-helix-helix domain-containing protein [Mesorhizobium sp.]|nr:ribbon-helix-helix protein, CopG family [Mesorhizobium sp.]MCO5161648.1 ribbon-helix-helix domain-containing protein [Mesorhizobium sp.]